MKQLNNEIIDLVCGMDLTKFPDRNRSLYQGKEFYFCGNECQKRFEKNPDKFQNEPLLKLKNLWKIFKIGGREIQVLKNLCLHIWEGDFVCIIGSSGSGKSTLLNMMGMLDKPTSGKVILRGKETSLLPDSQMAELRSKTFGFVFQQYNLIPWFTAYENVVLPLVFAERDIEKKKLGAIIQEFGLKERMTHRPFELSGGEQQRTALLRALVNNPEIILGDEPTGNLDSATGNKILNILINLNKVGKKTLIIVTHDADIARNADQIIIIKDGESMRDHQVHKKLYTE